MMQRWSRRLVVLLLAAAVGAGACGSDGSSGSSAESGGRSGLDGSITVFAAASLTDAFGELGRTFEDRHAGVSVDLNLAASSALREQILAGAPADVFASADEANMAQADDAGATAGDPAPFGTNRLEIAVPAGNPGAVMGLDDFAHDDLLIGLCAEEVPCGALGREALANAGVDLAEDTNEPDVRSLLTKVEAGDLDAGLVYHSDVVGAGDAVEGIEIPAGVNVATTYLIAVLSDAGNPDVARAFVEFVLSPDGQRILVSHGFERA